MDTEQGIDQEAHDLNTRRTNVLERLARDSHELSTLPQTVLRPTLKTVALGAAVGGTVVALVLYADHRRRERNRPLRRLEDAWRRLTTERRRSLAGRIVQAGLGALASTVANEAGDIILQIARAKLDQKLRDAAYTSSLPESTAIANAAIAPGATPAVPPPVPHDTRLPTAAVQAPQPFHPTVVPPMHDLI